MGLGIPRLPVSYSFLPSFHFPTPMRFDQRLVYVPPPFAIIYLSGGATYCSHSWFHDSGFPPRFSSAFVSLLSFMPPVCTHIVLFISCTRCYADRSFFLRRRPLVVSCPHTDFAREW
jgi:hypothetical protein